MCLPSRCFSLGDEPLTNTQNAITGWSLLVLSCHDNFVGIFVLGRQQQQQPVRVQLIPTTPLVFFYIWCTLCMHVIRG
jgi:hypothetical protein